MGSRLTETKAWRALQAHHAQVKDVHLRDLFDPKAISFDQRGVELGKVLAQRIIPELESDTDRALGHDSSTNNLMRRYRQNKGLSR